MKIHVLQHVPFEGLGCIETWVQKKGYHLTWTQLFNNQKLPEMNAFDGVIIMGGPMGVYDKDEYPWLEDEHYFIQQALEKEKKMLGICLGAQLIAAALGGNVYPSPNKEIGWWPISWHSEYSSIAKAQPAIKVLHWHGDTFDIPKGAQHIASSVGCPNQGFIFHDHVVGLQFHLEQTETSLEMLVAHCGHECDQVGEYIQQRETLLTLGKQHYSAVNQTMYELLDGVFEK